MIVKMKKIFLIVSKKDRDKFLVKLKETGTVHINEKDIESSEGTQKLSARLEEVTAALSIIGDNRENLNNPNDGEANDHVQKILSIGRQIETLKKELDEKQEVYKWFKIWGSVSIASLQKLEETGIFVRLYSVDKKIFKELPVNKQFAIVKRGNNKILFAYITDSEADRLDFDEIKVPKVEFELLETRITEIKEEIKKAKHSLVGMSQFRSQLLHYHTSLKNEVKLNKVIESMEGYGQISCLQGFCPVDELTIVEKLADEEGLAYLIQNPDNPNETPTLIRTPKWLQIINPVFKFMGAKPGYGEYDISLWFLIFFSIFFAMLVGDGGYGLIFIFSAFLFSRKKKNTDPAPFRLMYLLGGATVFWGAISGTWFGYEGFAHLPILNLFVVNQINSFIDTNQSFMMYLSFVIGVIHLTIARLMAVVKYINSIKAVAEVGWIAVLWSLFFLAGDLVLGKPLPEIIPMVFTIGLLSVLLFSNPQKQFIKGILQTLTELPLKVIGSFSDVVSYLRLFAVGYATVIVASSFNGMALDNGFGSLISGLISAAILFVGHTINIMLALMAVIVHGVRLNMLEFSGHLNMQWSGKNFEPFK